ncbi:MAG: hypothetical protein U9Q22_08730, partial [Candidatus Altiarchaeota archaeon]|nr:hypothetical protein [Candidatus Altiarchaeota archaeon]
PPPPARPPRAPALKLMDTIRLEQAVLKPYCNIHKVSGRLKLPSRSMGELIEALNGGGFKAVRTHFSNLGLRTDASISEVSDIISCNVK